MIIRQIQAGFVIAMLFTVGGCATHGSLGMKASTSIEVRRLAGKPTNIWIAENGDSVWEYATGPFGRQTYIYRFAKDGRLKDAREALTEQTVARIKVGESGRAQVRELMGPPSDVLFFPKGETWEYKMEEISRLTFTLYVVFDNNGIVREVGRVMDPTDGRRFFGGHR
jgi:hypothetical protein